MKTLELYNVTELNESEIQQTDGGLLINIFLWGVAYGYVVEKLESGQW